jgi:hypothetical protein
MLSLTNTPELAKTMMVVLVIQKRAQFGEQEYRVQYKFLVKVQKLLSA